MAGQMRDEVGWKASGPSILWASVGGLVGSIIIGIPMQMRMGALENTAAALVGSDSLAVGWVVHILAGVVFGALYGVYVATTSLGHGAGWGALYGLLVGIIPVWLGINLILGRGLPMNMVGMTQILVHVAWGLVVGLVQAWALKSTGAGSAAGRRGARTL